MDGIYDDWNDDDNDESPSKTTAARATNAMPCKFAMRRLLGVGASSLKAALTQVCGRP